MDKKKLVQQLNNPNLQLWRGKRIDNNKWQKGQLYPLTTDNGNFGIFYVCDTLYKLGKYCMVEVENGTISASTNFRDVDNEDIFVGDIIEYIDNFDGEKYIGVVSFDDVNQTVPIVKQLVKLKNGKYSLVNSIVLEHTKDRKILGNIWDNLDILLKEVS